MQVLQSFLVLLVFQLGGEALSKLGHVPIPGPVIGMVLLAAWYIFRKREPEPHLDDTANGLLGWLGLLFVPAGVGIVASLQLLKQAWFSVTIGLVVSTLLTLVVTALVMNRMKRGSV